MGKATGFLEYARHAHSEREIENRVKDWNEFSIPVPEKERRNQGARCMDCGIPFCQSGIVFEGKRIGCPLHNLIPEWNDMIFRENPEHALSRLLKTAPFPEFTGRICPALCETGCNCADYSESVTIKDNELYLIEYAFANGLMAPKPPKYRSDMRVAVVGSGPAGLACAYWLNKRGHTVHVFERDHRPGGLLVYGIPNMKLDKAVVERRIRLMEAEGVVFFIDHAVDAAELSRLEREYDRVVLCCGAQKPRNVRGVEPDGKSVFYALDYLSPVVKKQLGEADACPDAGGKKLIIIGNGNTASDCVGTAVRQGAADIIQVIRKPESAYGPETDYAHAETEAIYKKDVRLFESNVKSLNYSEDGALVSAVVVTAGEEHTVACDMLIIASGFSGTEDGNKALQTAAADKTIAAGDMVAGATLVVLALADGRRAAHDVDEAMMGYTPI